MFTKSTLHKLRVHSLYINISGCTVAMHCTFMQKQVRIMGYGV